MFKIYIFWTNLDGSGWQWLRFIIDGSRSLCVTLGCCDWSLVCL